MSEVAAPRALRPGTAWSVLSDDRLAQRATKGDRRAFAAIYRRYHQGLYRFCLAIVGNSQDAQDALQNTMVKVLRALPGEKRQIQLKPWLYRIAHNESIALLRRRRGTVELDPEQAALGSGLAEEAAVRERLRRLVVDLDELPERQRAVLVMRELSGLDYAEIGAALDASPATVRQTLYEARLGLHEMEAGREMSCAAVTKALSDADGRVTRRRDVRAHLRSCASCRNFREELEGRQHDLAALAPLPAVAAAGLLHGILGGGTVKALGASALVKSATAVAVVAAVGVSADRGGIVDVGLPGGGGSPPASQSSESPAPRSADGAQAAGATPAAVRRRRAAHAGLSGAAAAGVIAGRRSDSNAERTGSPSQGSAGHSRSNGHTRSHPHGRGHAKQHPAAAAHGQPAAAHKGGNQGGQAGAGQPTKPPRQESSAGAGTKEGGGLAPKAEGSSDATAPPDAQPESQQAIPPTDDTNP